MFRSAQHDRCGNASTVKGLSLNETDRALARNTTPQQSDTGATSRRASSALSAWEVSVCEKFWRSLSALRNRRLAKHPDGQGQTAEASPQSTDRYRALA